MRRALVPVILLVFASASTTVAVRVDAEEPLLEPLAAPAVVTPVLSGRRVPSYLARPVGDRRLVEGLAAIVASLPAASCLLVEEGGRRLFAHNTAAPLLGASAQKLVTAIAALARLGHDTRLRTTVGVTSRAGAVVEGDLWLVGGGDPLLATADYVASFERQPQLRTSLERLADRVVAAGVREVRGRVVGDETRLDNLRFVPSWRTTYVTDNDSGPLSALTVNDGFVTFVPDRVEQNLRAPDPPAHAAGALTGLLRARGVVVTGEPASGDAPDDLEEVAQVASPPMTEVVGQMLRESDNLSAELLLKEIGLASGGPGSTAAGAAAAAATIQDQGLPGAGAVVADGSGLDRGNRVTCDLLVAILRKVKPDSAVGRGLAVAGRTGTLWKRFKGTPVEGRLRAKTGTLFDTTALAGFMDSVAGNRLTFALVVNGLPSQDALLGFQNSVADLLVRYPDLPALGQLGPEPLTGAA